MPIYWTIQTEQKWTLALQKGVLIGERGAVWPEFLAPYNWMKEQIYRRLSLPMTEEQQPIWLWTERPDLRRSGHLERGTRGVLLKVELEANKILFSDFQAWHIVLMNDFLQESVDAREHVTTWTECEKRRSWERIFDFDWLRNHPDWGEPTVQGVTPYIATADVMHVQPFTAK